VEEEKGSFLYKDKAATYCFDCESNEPVCHTAVGFLSEVVDWAVENKYWHVHEVECMAQGRPCCIYKVFRTN
jgi:predicted hydrocarbon binding protein